MQPYIDHLLLKAMAFRHSSQPFEEPLRLQKKPPVSHTYWQSWEAVNGSSRSSCSLTRALVATFNLLLLLFCYGMRERASNWCCYLAALHIPHRLLTQHSQIARSLHTTKAYTVQSPSRSIHISISSPFPTSIPASAEALLRIFLHLRTFSDVFSAWTLRSTTASASLA